ncbi:MAG: manganese efflux pump [Clostridia bacterium]|nr:manganese efflux pump [Clostridia bacterium]
MSNTELFILAIGLSMDAFAVAICKGLSVSKLKPVHMLITGLYFGIFQAFMPLIGYFLGKQFESLITDIDHWIAFVLLSIIGINMIRESFGDADEFNDKFTPRIMLPLAVATSIDALAVGVTLAFLKVNVVSSVSFIGIVTFILSALGVKIGNIFGSCYKSVSERIGGVVLIAMGTKILLEHLGIIDF